MKNNNHLSAVKSYYDKYWPAYAIGWNSQENLAMHFGYYDSAATDHDGSVARLIQKLAELAKITKEDKVLDAGSGVGGSSIWLAKAVGCHVTGVNVVSWQNQLARQSAKVSDVDSKVTFKLADFANTNLPSGSYSVWWAVESFCHAANKPKVIEEAYRLLKPGGRMLIFEYFIRPEPLSKVQKQLFQKWYDGQAVPELLREEQCFKMLQDAGFNSIKSKNLTRFIKPSLEVLRSRFEALNPSRAQHPRIFKNSKDQALIYRTTKAQVQTFDQGLWQYKAITAVKPAYLASRAS